MPPHQTYVAYERILILVKGPSKTLPQLDLCNLASRMVKNTTHAQRPQELNPNEPTKYKIVACYGLARWSMRTSFGYYTWSKEEDPPLPIQQESSTLQLVTKPAEALGQGCCPKRLIFLASHFNWNPNLLEMFKI